MTNEEAAKMLTAKVECMKRETSGIDSDCNDRHCDNCDLCYAQGTMGEQKEALRMAIEALEKQIPKKVRRKHHPKYGRATFCPNCSRMDVECWFYCPDCGQAIDWSEEG